ncbi:MAG: DEAD/DEAH box helicase family protein [Erysipelotrichaceae bacterium]|nr:DEAD/DEAH box helicase family protein [Erysipelotrichaceae bacterium]
MSVFSEYREKFILEPKSNSGLRRCQLGAIWALKSFFVANSPEVAALISMPTGSGKSAIMMASCFELGLSKILIIEPSKVLRNQICEQFRSLEILKDIGCLPDDFPETKVFEVKHIQSPEDWPDIIEKNDVIVAHPNSISPYYKRISALPADLIDAIFMDEAHHEAAPTWKAINTYYKSVKRIFLTATPFRRDRKAMEAKLIYHYSLKQAFDDNILRPIDFIGVQAGTSDYESDSILIEAAKKAFEEEKSRNPVFIMIRTDRISHTQQLLERYNSYGFKVDIVHSDREDKENLRVVNEVKESKLDGLISVGMASEGLDIPLLKIAVLHTTPKSIPYTIQFLGRISRQPTEQSGNAILIANTDEVRGEVYRLYNSDETWAKLVPQLIDENMRKARYYRSALIDDPDFVLPDLNIYFSAIIYDVKDEFTFNTEFNVKSTSPFRISYISQQDTGNPLVIITEMDKPIEWANREIYIGNYLDIHIFYHVPDKNLLFELTSSEEALNAFSENLYIGDTRIITHSKLYKALSKFDKENYLMVGMKNTIMPGSSHPSYKTFIGNSVQGTIRNSEGRVFGVGHALMKMGEKKTWGIATKKGRVWAMKRGTLDEYQSWCDDIADLLTTSADRTTLPGLTFLASTTPINMLEEIPLAIIPDDSFFRANLLSISIKGDKIYSNIVPNIEPRSFDKTTGNLISVLSIESFFCQIVMNFKNSPLWTVISDEDIKVTLVKNQNNVITASLEKIFNDFPPTLIMPKGYIVEGRTKITPNCSIESLPNGLWVKKDWSKCNITAEAYKPKPNPKKLPVINQTIEFIKVEFDVQSDVLVLDDGAHEIADVIWIQGSKHTIHYIHCKPSNTLKPGCRKGDCDIVFTQAMRSVHWVNSELMFERLNERLSGKSKIILGHQQLLDDIAKNFRVNEWQYKIVVVQPGFDIAKVSNRIRKNNNIYELAIPTYERIIAGLADFEVWGS